MSARSIGEKVVCSDCGRILKGAPAVRRGFHLRKHKRPDGTNCWGARSTDHRPAPKDGAK